MPDSTGTAEQLRAVWGPVQAQAGTYEVRGDTIMQRIVVSKNPAAMRSGDGGRYRFRMAGDSLWITNLTDRSTGKYVRLRGADQGGMRGAWLQQEIRSSAGTVTGDADSWRLVANCYIAARENDRALAPLAKAAELAPDGETYMLLGQIHLQAERFDEALDALQKSLAKSRAERRGAVHLLIGVAQLGVDRFDEAERSFRAAQADDKTRRAADSYLTFLEQERARSAQREALRTASAE